jgi:hypothetical protein
MSAEPNSQLREADSQFFLGLYRSAVDFYQPRIEKKTGIPLGNIRVCDFRQLDADRLINLAQQKPSWLYRLFLGKKFAEMRTEVFRQKLESTRSARENACLACYYRRAFYVSFAHDIQHHEAGLAYATVHELSHALWETIEGLPLDEQRTGTDFEREKFALLVEGFAMYAELSWFWDLYPHDVRMTIQPGPPMPGSLHDRGLQRVTELVDKFGQEILMEMPKRWRSF